MVDTNYKRFVFTTCVLPRKHSNRHRYFPFHCLSQQTLFPFDRFERTLRATWQEHSTHRIAFVDGPLIRTAENKREHVMEEEFLMTLRD
ncbi:hypothetical protein GCK72_005047 [Caenorhabditis remanei]|uniref:Uncharacterized protein n=1 Tax=Caenorhabditis remanei TaxID=31234 RepID=A0A6A5HCS6_CAERE|nr:hypothetical protein GCK72_005047 [Caenorhabditis remanei]KAF1765095.1 hypothetical protein GCK72_005047 [Caenorhabditis remanei]